MQQGTLTRGVTRNECPWLYNDLAQGKEIYEFVGYTYGCISDGAVAVSDKPDMHPFYEVPADAVSWNIAVNILTLPTDPALVTQLQAKLAEYKQRLLRNCQEGNDSLVNDDSTCKIAIMESLLTNGHVALNAVREELLRDQKAVGRLNNAFGVIADYCDTGGANIHGGTGLKNLT